MLLKYEKNRIYANDDNNHVIAEVTFPFISDSVVNIDHTFVDSSLRGRGIADSLLNAATAHICEQGFKAVATCPYAVKWFEAHPEHKNVLK